jgi:hypothetical protein
VRAAYLQPGHVPKAAGGGERYHLGMDGAEAPASRRSPKGCLARVQSVKDDMPVELPKFDASIRDLRQIRGVTGDLVSRLDVGKLWVPYGLV